MGLPQTGWTRDIFPFSLLTWGSVGMHTPDRPPVWPLSSDSCGQVVAAGLLEMLQGTSLSRKSLELVQPRAVIPDAASHTQGGKRTSSVHGLGACSLVVTVG